MEKFLKVTNAPITGQIISLNGVKAISTATATATTVTIDYVDGTTTTVTTSAQVAHDVYSAILNAVEQALIEILYPGSVLISRTNLQNY